MFTEQSSRISFLDSLRAIAIFMVVGMHTFPYCHPLDQQTKEILDLIVNSVSVPMFFLIDGFLFISKYENTKHFRYYSYIHKSAKRLLLPWLIFSILYTLCRYLFEYLGFVSSKLIIGKTISSIFINMYGSVITPQLYFLLSLFGIRIFSIWSIYLANIHKILVLIVYLLYLPLYHHLIVLITSVTYVKGGQEPILHCFWGFQFWLAGTVIVRYREKIMRNALLISIMLFASMLLSIIYLSGKPESIFVQYSYLFGLFAFAAAFPKRHLLSKIGEKTMGIYLLHTPLILIPVALIIKKLVNNALLSYFSIILLTIIIALIFTKIIYKIPKGKIVFGE